MRKASLALAALVAFGFACGSALAAGNNITNDAAGQAPNMDQMTSTTHDPLTRAQVEQAAIQDPPVGGQASDRVTPADPPSATFEQTQQRVDRATMQDHGFPDASGSASATVQD